MSAPNRIVRSQSHVVSPSSLGRLRSIFTGRAATQTGTTLRPTKSLVTLQEANTRNLPDLWFSSTIPRHNGPPGPQGRKPQDERNVKLGKTLRILQERLPTLLQSPLPQEILSPYISLHLFPSTHPHLPTVSGRVAYIAALWTSPIAWNRVPIVGNVKLEIMSERMVKQPLHFSPKRQGAVGEQLVVRWRTIGKTKGWGLTPKDESKEFTGLFIFEFDNDGRVLSHTIEHVQEGGEWENGVGAKVVGLTDWLLGGIRGGREGDSTPCPAFHGGSNSGRR